MGGSAPNVSLSQVVAIPEKVFLDAEVPSWSVRYSEGLREPVEIFQGADDCFLLVCPNWRVRFKISWGFDEMYVP